MPSVQCKSTCRLFWWNVFGTWAYMAKIEACLYRKPATAKRLTDDAANNSLLWRGCGENCSKSSSLVREQWTTSPLPLPTRAMDNTCGHWSEVTTEACLKASQVSRAKHHCHPPPAPGQSRWNPSETHTPSTDTEGFRFPTGCWGQW